MKYLAIFVLLAFVFCGAAEAKKAFKDALGMSACTDCHVKGKFKEPNPTNKMWAAAKEWVGNIEKGEKGAKGKTCMDCHKGQQKPKK